ncbi:helix-turn-helix domain-containing protein [Pseudomonas sp. USTB-Z]|jgi:ribosome-binding protein aMBF1 (putative translation factor)|uniref:helix-turn-helix domain-containing protein n=1 Tax=Pseudomonas TaxID=286 RepID=UPI0018AAAD94|nr:MULTISPECIES: helix-turn-helix domain-containing protein [Pseudomonas]MBF8789666.1 helix-turn-helix domain-containing protein [Pseudomonas asiatica]MBX6689175.1 helix-turn-helix domain-containing protein [Pseudomonas sp. USTB-Z]
MTTLVQLRSATELGVAVRQVRKQQAIIQTDLADMLGKSHVLLRDIETGKGTVAIASVLQVLNELGIRLYAELPE